MASLEAPGGTKHAEDVFLYQTLTPDAPSPCSWISDFRELIICFAQRYGANPQKAVAIVSCEGGFSDPGICNKTFGCASGQGAFQFIPSTWANVILAHPFLPNSCHSADSVFDFRCNVDAGTWLLAVEGDSHWKPYSGACWLSRLK